MIFIKWKSKLMNKYKKIIKDKEMLEIFDKKERIKIIYGIIIYFII